MRFRRRWRRRKGVEGTGRTTDAREAADRLADASRVVIVPGYGMAVAQAQRAVRHLADTLEARGVEVVYAVHPVAGRMPGHVSVLLGEAGVADASLKGPEDVNPGFPSADVALVVGANDVTNPAAGRHPSGPLQALPTLDAHLARRAIVIKRSLNPGFTGVDNDLFRRATTQMLFADARAAVEEIAAELERV